MSMLTTANKEVLTPKQAARIVVKYLKEHPGDLHANGVILTVAALKEAFPCK